MGRTTTTISTDGTWEIPGEINAGTSVLYVSGVLSTAAVKLVVPNGRGGYADLADGAITVMDTQYIITHGKGVEVFVNVTSADGSTDLTFINANAGTVVRG